MSKMDIEGRALNKVLAVVATATMAIVSMVAPQAAMADSRIPTPPTSPLVQINVTNVGRDKYVIGTDSNGKDIYADDPNRNFVSFFCELMVTVPQGSSVDETYANIKMEDGTVQSINPVSENDDKTFIDYAYSFGPHDSLEAFVPSGSSVVYRWGNYAPYERVSYSSTSRADGYYNGSDTGSQVPTSASSSAPEGSTFNGEFVGLATPATYEYDVNATAGYGYNGTYSHASFVATLADGATSIDATFERNLQDSALVIEQDASTSDTTSSTYTLTVPKSGFMPNPLTGKVMTDSDGNQVTYDGYMMTIYREVNSISDAPWSDGNDELSDIPSDPATSKQRIGTPIIKPTHKVVGDNVVFTFTLQSGTDVSAIGKIVGMNGESTNGTYYDSAWVDIVPGTKCTLACVDGDGVSTFNDVSLLHNGYLKSHGSPTPNFDDLTVADDKKSASFVFWSDGSWYWQTQAANRSGALVKVSAKSTTPVLPDAGMSGTTGILVIGGVLVAIGIGYAVYRHRRNPRQDASDVDDKDGDDQSK